MVTLFVLGAFGLKAAIVVYLVYRFAKYVNEKGTKIRDGYEDRIRAQVLENRRLRKEMRKQARLEAQLATVPVSKEKKGKKVKQTFFPQRGGDA